MATIRDSRGGIPMLAFEPSNAVTSLLTAMRAFRWTDRSLEVSNTEPGYASDIASSLVIYLWPY